MYKIIDKITGEILSFTNKYDVECEAERRLNRHRSGYDYKRNHVDGINATLKYEGDTFIIC